MTIRAIRQSAIGLRHANLTRDLPTRPSAFERLGTLKAEADPLTDIARDLRETRAIIADLNQQISLGGEAEKYARGMLKLMTKHRSDLLRLKCSGKSRSVEHGKGSEMYEALQIVGFFGFCWIGLGLFLYGFLLHQKQR
jgi:hypothetical protein